jgi:hypothetical protein
VATNASSKTEWAPSSTSHDKAIGTARQTEKPISSAPNTRSSG